MVHLSDAERQLLVQLEDDDWVIDDSLAEQIKPVLEALTALYFTEARTRRGRIVDPVARFHLGNGARLERINWLGDKSEKGLRESAGLMVNYIYSLDEIEKNHEAFANKGEVVASQQVKKLLRANHKHLPVAIEKARKAPVEQPPPVERADANTSLNSKSSGSEALEPGSQADAAPSDNEAATADTMPGNSSQ